MPQPSQWHGRSIGVLSIFGSAEPTILWHLLPLGNVTLFGVIPGTLSPASLGAPAGVTGVVNPPTTPSGSSGEYLLRFLSTGRRHSMPAPRNNGAVPRNRLGCQRSANEPRRDGKIVSYEKQSGKFAGRTTVQPPLFVSFPRSAFPLRRDPPAGRHNQRQVDIDHAKAELGANSTRVRLVRSSVRARHVRARSIGTPIVRRTTHQVGFGSPPVFHLFEGRESAGG